MMSNIVACTIGHSYIYFHEITLQIMCLLSCLSSCSLQKGNLSVFLVCPAWYDPLCLGWPSFLSLFNISFKVWLIGPFPYAASSPTSLSVSSGKTSFPYSTPVTWIISHHNSELQISIHPQTRVPWSFRASVFLLWICLGLTTVPATFKHSGSLRCYFGSIKEGITTYSGCSCGWVKVGSEHCRSHYSFIHLTNNFGTLAMCQAPEMLGYRDDQAIQNLHPSGI